MRVARVWDRTTGEQEVCRQIFLTHADALPNEVVLVSPQLALKTCQLTSVLFIFPCRPICVYLGQVLQTEIACEFEKAVVELEVFAVLCMVDGEGERLSGE